MIVVSITYDSDNAAIARTFENIEDAQLFAETYVKNSPHRGSPAVNIAGV
jgi:hypothetical protein